ncbi:LIM domain-binding protein 2-like isoform X2 [Oppia nitens]|uniref:LIM domain-binding protein 2-like isoform X2 n=1 Tax=Oppia nitens TaxID=1686743 RepID=UPI0023DAD6D7|nr:LIM domain-binding protein 2-like isoform X2 [Oppia nitens]
MRPMFTNNTMPSYGGHSPHGPPPPPPHPSHGSHVSHVSHGPMPPTGGHSPHAPMNSSDGFVYNSPMMYNNRRHTPYFGQPDYRVYEMNKRLQQRSEIFVNQESDNLWWDAFATEFFEDDATLTLTFCLEDGPKRYTIGRTLIPRYFRSIFEGGVTELSINMKHTKESFHNTTITLDCDQCSMITQHGKPYIKPMGPYPNLPNDPMKDQMAKEHPVIVCTEGRLILEFTFDDLMRIKSWHFATRHHQELIPRGIVAIQAQQDPTLLEQMSKNITRQGLTNSTLNYLRLCVILEPMQELMTRHKTYSLSPRDCLKTTLFQKWQRMVAPPETTRPPSKRRKRKSSANAGTTGGAGKKKNNNAANMSPGPPNFTLASQDVMVVGEPSLMGGEFGDEDERLITRLENHQFDPNVANVTNGLEECDDFGPLGGPHGGPPGNGPPPGWPGGHPPGSSMNPNSGPPLPNVNNGHSSHGPGSHGPGSHGPGSHGPGSHGPGSHGPGSHGPGSHGPGSHGPGSHDDKKQSPNISQ